MAHLRNPWLCLILTIALILPALIGAQSNEYTRPQMGNNFTFDPVGFSLQGCSEENQYVLEADMNDLEFMMNCSVARVHENDTYFTSIFGVNAPDENAPSNDEMKIRFETIGRLRAHAVEPKPTVRCDWWNSPNKQCSEHGTLAGMTTSAFSPTPVIWLCSNYWRTRRNIMEMALPSWVPAPIDPYIPGAGILIHEFTHALYGTIDEKLVNVFNTNQSAWGHQNVLHLLFEEDGNRRARGNADSYRIFSAMVTLGRDTFWSLDRGNLGSHQWTHEPAYTIPMWLPPEEPHEIGTPPFHDAGPGGDAVPLPAPPYHDARLPPLVERVKAMFFRA